MSKRPAAILCLLILAGGLTSARLLTPDQGDPESRPERIAELLQSPDPFDRIVLETTRSVLSRKYYEEGADIHPACLELETTHIILDPNTEPERLAELMERLGRKYSVTGKTNYRIWGRWTTTATDGPTGIEGDPVTLLWGFMPDSVFIASDAEIMEPGGPNIANLVFGSTFGNPNQWKRKMRKAMARWDGLLGTTYLEVTYDDSASFPDSPGIVGVRPDIRIGGRSIDGNSGILAYNNFPFNGGDMVLDTDDAAAFANPTNDFTFLKNVTMHEHGHGMGLGHVTPVDGTKLMEAFVGLGGLGPFDDDIRGAQLLYGDLYENNDIPSTAAFLDTLVDSLLVTDLSIDHGAEDDYYIVVMNDPFVDIAVIPVGSTYLLGIQNGPPPVSISTDMISDPDVELYDSLGTTLIASGTSAGLGETELMSSVQLPYAGAFIIRVFRKTGTGDDIQRYDLQMNTSVSTSIAYNDLPSARAFTISPNPFNPMTTVRFTLGQSGRYELSIHDVAGRLVRSIRSNGPAGEIEIAWDGRDNSGRDAPSGTYFLTVDVGSRMTKKVMLVR